MKTVNVQEAMKHISALLSEVEGGEEVVIARDGEPVVRMTRVEQVRRQPQPGAWRRFPGWENYTYDPSVFAPMTDEELKEEGWE